MSPPMGLGLGLGLSFGGGAGWDPRRISGLGLWLRGDMGYTLNGSTVSAWADLSGAGTASFIQNTVGAQPTWLASAINGKPGLVFDGTSDFLQATGFPTTWTAAEMFIVVQATNDPGVVNKTGLYSFGPNVNDTHFPFTDGIIYDDFAATVRKTTVNPAPALTAAHVYSVRSSATEWTSWLDNAQLFTTGANVVGLRSNPTLGRTVTATTFFDGTIAEIAIYTRTLTAGERTTWSNYAKARYGTP